MAQHSAINRIGRPSFVVVVCALGAWTTTCHGQGSIQPVTIGQARAVSTVDNFWREPVIAASRTNENEFVVYSYAAGYSVSINGGATIYTYSSPFATSDPIACAEPGTGRIWVGGLDSSTGTVRMAVKEPGQIALPASPGIAFGSINDRPVLGIGRDPSNSSLMRYHVLANGSRFLSAGCFQGTGPLKSLSSTALQAYDPPAGGSPANVSPYFQDSAVRPPSQNISGTCDFEGWGATPVVMNDGSVVAGTSDAFDLALNPKYNNGLPLVVYSPDGGATWRPDDATPIKLGNNLGIFAPSRNTSPTSIGDTPLPLDKRTAACATARDEINDDVYVAFAGCDNPNAGTDRNTDIYIFRSEPGTAGKVWRDPITGQQQEGREYIRITDAMLGVPAGSIKSWGPDQMVPAIAIDCTGAICLTYYDNRNDANGTPYTNNRVDVYFTRVHGLGSGTVTIDPPVVLTSSTFPLGGSDLTDFGSLAVAGTTSRVVYPAYMARKLNSNGTWSNPVCFVHKITMNQCIGDPGDGFSAAYAQQIEDAILVGDPQGDIYEDQSVDIDDFILLQQWKETAGIP